MANHKNDPTANTALGAIDREIREKRKEARRAAHLIRSGQLTVEQENCLRRSFTGIFRRLLQEALQEDAA